MELTSRDSNFSLMPLKIKFLVFSLLLFISNSAGAEEMAIIVHPSNAITDLTLNDFKHLYLRRQKTFPNRITAAPFDVADNAQLRDDFLMLVTEKTSKQLESYWAYLIFSGEGEPPIKVESYETMLKMVSTNSGGIGYLPKSLVNDELVKVVLTINVE